MKKISASIRLTRHARIGIKPAASVMLVALCLVLCVMSFQNQPMSRQSSLGAASNLVSPITFFDSAKVHALSEADVARYTYIFSAQKAGRFNDADDMLSSLEDQRLMGTLLAERYLNPSYTTTPDELKAWLSNYSDQPEAARIAKIAAQKGVKFSDATINNTPSIHGIGRVDTIGNTDMPRSWFLGLKAWRGGNFAQAAQQFAEATTKKELSDWQKSAAYFWLYRAHAALHDEQKANSALSAAASYPLTFYGMIAQNIAGGTLRLMASSPYVDERLRTHNAVLRAKALSQIGQTALAERELRTLFKQLQAKDRASLITLASEMNLPNLQVRLSRLPELSDEERIFANYPMPQWLAAEQLRVDNALLLAISRQESSFSAEARSHAGAAGLMQLMPKTANYIFNKSSESVVASISGSDVDKEIASKTLLASDLSDPKTNLLLGQEYVQYLARKPFIGSSIIHILSSYNAGPGIVYSWNKTATNITDPLLYIESIPYTETRHYVMQVLANYWAYQSLMGQNTDSLTAITRGQWPEIAS